MQIGMFLTTFATIVALATFFLFGDLNLGDKSIDWPSVLSILLEPKIKP